MAFPPLPGREGEVYGGKLRQRHTRGAGERAERHVLAADLGRVVHAGAAEFLAVARQQLAQHAALGQANDKIVIAHGREVAHAHEPAAVARRAQEGDGAALGVVHVQPCEAVPAAVDVPERAVTAVAGVERTAPALHGFVHRVVEQQPVEPLLVVPLDELAEFRAHERELLARMRELIAVERAQCGKLLLIGAVHLVEHRLLAVYDLVVRKREDEVLREGVHHRERQLVVVVFAEVGVELQIVERVVHKAHVPLEAEAETAVVGRLRHAGVGGGFLRDRHAAGPRREHSRVELLQKGDRAEVDVAAVAVRRPFAVAPGVVEIQHRGHRVHADAVDVIAVEKRHGRRDEKALHLRHCIVENERAPLRMLGHARVLALVEPRAVKAREPVRVLRKVRRDPVHDHADTGAVERVDKVHEVLRRAVAAGGGVVPGHLIAPGALVGVFRHGQQLHVRVVHLSAVVRQLVCDRAVPRQAGLRPAPGAEVHLVNAHRRAVYIACGAAAQIAPVVPDVALDCPDLGCGRGPGLAVRGEWVGLEHRLAVRAGDGVFIERPVAQTLHGLHPRAVRQAVHRRCCRVPAVEVAHERDALCVRRPDGEAVPSRAGERVAAERAVSVHGRAGMKFLQLRLHGEAGRASCLIHGAPPISQSSTIIIPCPA